MSTSKLPEVIPLSEIWDAHQQLREVVKKTPLVPLNYSCPGTNIYLKLENLQPGGSFKIRGAYNAFRKIPGDELKNGVWTVSSGNFAQGLTWSVRRQNVPCNVVVPFNCPSVKLSAIERSGGRITRVPYDKWHEVIETGEFENMTGKLIHPICNADVISGNGTIGLEIMEDLPNVDSIIAPFGGGSVCCGVASAVKSLKPGVRVYACEVETAAPLNASLRNGRPVRIDRSESFVDTIGGKTVVADIWPLIHRLVDDSIVVDLQQTADALKLIAEKNHLIAEGAASATVAAALTGKAGKGNIVCVISGGNIDTGRLIQALQGNVPI